MEDEVEDSPPVNILTVATASARTLPSTPTGRAASDGVLDDCVDSSPSDSDSPAFTAAAPAPDLASTAPAVAEPRPAAGAGCRHPLQAQARRSSQSGSCSALLFRKRGGACGSA